MGHGYDRRICFIDTGRYATYHETGPVLLVESMLVRVLEGWRIIRDEIEGAVGLDDLKCSIERFIGPFTYRSIIKIGDLGVEFLPTEIPIQCIFVPGS